MIKKIKIDKRIADIKELQNVSTEQGISKLFRTFVEIARYYIQKRIRQTLSMFFWNL